MDHLCYSFIVFVILSRLYIAAMCSPEGKGLTSWLLFVMFIVIMLLSLSYAVLSVPCNLVITC